MLENANISISSGEDTASIIIRRFFGMLTAFGRYVRKLRIDSGYLLKDMADFLGVTSSYLSAVEMGKRKIPIDWADKIIAFFDLKDNMIDELYSVIQESQQDIQLNLSKASKEQRNLAFAFARKLDRLDEDEIRDMFNIFKKNGDDK